MKIFNDNTIFKNKFGGSGDICAGGENKSRDEAAIKLV